MPEDFTWRDGERLIRFGPSAAAEAEALLRENGFTEYLLLTTERARASAPALAERATRGRERPHRQGGRDLGGSAAAS